MNIEPKILARYLHAAALEQMRSELTQAGYEVDGQSSGQGTEYRPDLVARRGSEVIAVEAKVLGERFGGKLTDASRWAREHGARLRLLLIRPQREVGIRLEGVEDFLLETLRTAENNFPAPLAGAHVGGVTDVLLGEAEIGLGASDTEISGSALALFDPPGRGDERDAAGPVVPFTFKLWLDPGERRLTRLATIKWDLSELDEDA